MKRKTVITLTASVALAAAATVTTIALRSTHPLQKHRWVDPAPPGNCGPGPPVTMEFGRDGIVRSWSVANPSGIPLPYIVSGNRITFGSGASRWEGEYTITGKSLSIRMLGMAGTEWENHTRRYEAE